MKKIKSARHLREERMALRVRELELGKSIRQDWKELKEKWKSPSILKNSDDSSGWLTGLLHAASTSITKKLLQKAEEKIEESSNKGIEFFTHRLVQLRKRRKVQ